MKKYVLLLCLSVLAPGLFAQQENSIDSQTTKKLSKEEKKERKKASEEEMAKMVDWMVNHKNFVLEADYMSNQTGERVVVSSRINFIAVDSNKITIQLASNTGMGGSNGMGGVTADGIISKYDVKKSGKSGNIYSVEILTTTHIGSYDIFFSITPNGNADASIGGSWSGKLNYHGYLVPVKKSKVFKGMSI